METSPNLVEASQFENQCGHFTLVEWTHKPPRLADISSSSLVQVGCHGYHLTRKKTVKP